MTWRSSVAELSAQEQGIAVQQSALARRRRRTAAALTAVLGAAAVAWALRIPPGDPQFQVGTAALVLIWVLGAIAAGRPLRRSRERRWHWRSLVLGLAIGVLMLGLFLLGAGLVVQVPLLRDQVLGLLAHTTGAGAPVALTLTITAANGLAEELYFRGSLHDAVIGRWAPVITTAAYAVIMSLSGIWLLGFAALVMGAVFAALRLFSDGLAAPVTTHLVWSVGMFFWLAPALEIWS